MIKTKDFLVLKLAWDYNWANVVNYEQYYSKGDVHLIIRVQVII